MKVFLYTEGLKAIKKSGLGHAIEHQKKALNLAHVDYSLNSHDDYDILHINTYFIKSYFVAKYAKKHGKKVVYHALSDCEYNEADKVLESKFMYNDKFIKEGY